MTTDWTAVINRIAKSYNNFTDDERTVLRTIVEEIAEYGQSPTYEQVWSADFKEIPVDKYTFMTSPYYLGPSNNNGASIYPAWMDTFLELERAGNQYTEIVFTGATRTGKTSSAVADAAYMLYWLMCLRDPQSYFGLKSITNISIFFFNITQTLARGVAFKEFNTLLSVSPWFLKHGHMNASEAYPTYIPDGGLITIEYGSDATHALGKASFCLVGDTQIVTSTGLKKLSDICGVHDVAQLSPEGVIYVSAVVDMTDVVTDTIRIELEDGFVFEGTPEHKVMLTDGSYKMLKDLTESDDIKTFYLHGGV